MRWEGAWIHLSIRPPRVQRSYLRIWVTVIGWAPRGQEIVPDRPEQRTFSGSRRSGDLQISGEPEVVKSVAEQAG